MLLKNAFLFLAIFTIQIGALSDFFADFFHYYGDNFRVTIFGCNKKESMLSKTLIYEGYVSRFLSTNTEKLLYPVPPYRNFFLINLDCENSSELLQKAHQENLFSSPFRWLAYYQETDIQNLLETVFLNLPILVDSDFNVAEMYLNGTVLIQKIGKKHPTELDFFFEDFGIWNKNSGFLKYEHFQSSVAKRRKKLDVGLNACIVITHNDSLNHLTDKRDKHIDSVTKVGYIMVRVLASIYNISLNVSVKDSWGYKNNRSNQWSGMMGELTTRRADIGGSPLFLIKERIDLIDYLAMVTPTRSKFVFRQPKLSYITNVYTLPFDKKVWFSTILMMVIMIIALFGLMKWEWTVKKRVEYDTTQEPIRRAIYQKKVSPSGKPSNFMPIEEGVKKVREGLFAFHMETGSGYKIVSETFREDEKCGLQEIAFLQVEDPWLAIQKNSSYKEMLKIGLLLLHENGVQQRENNLIYTRKPICTSKTSTFFSVGIVDCYPAAAILAGGVAASMVVFILELYLSNRIKFYKRHWQAHFEQPAYQTEDFKEDMIYHVFQTVSKVKRNSEDIFLH